MQTLSRAAVACSLLLCAVAPRAQAPQDPNVVLIYVDDLNTDLGTYGHPVVRTPNIDRLASRGLVFENAYCADAVCNASRASMLSGLRPDKTHIVINEELPLDPTIGGMPTIPLWFRLHGYRVGGAGKIVHGAVPLQGYYEPSTWDESHNEVNDRGVPIPVNPFPQDGWRVLYGGPFRNGMDDSVRKMADTKVVDAALDMLQRYAAQPQPFFVAVGLVAPHAPLIYPERFDSLYAPAQVPALPAGEATNWRAEVPWDLYASDIYVDPNWGATDDDRRRQATVAYWRTLAYVDEQVGRVLDRIDTLGIANDTVIVFVGDHGWSNGLHGRFQKFSLYEEAARTPLIVAAPWIASSVGTRTARPVEQVHLYPTLLELCGLPAPPGLDGTSLVPLMQDQVATFPPAFSVKPSGWGLNMQWMVRTDRYKFIRWEDGQHVLFDLVTDPGEYDNLYGDPAYAQVVTDHLALLDQAGLTDAEWMNYGIGLAGTLGVPDLISDTAPVLGTQIVLTLGNSSGLPANAAIFFGVGGAAWPVVGGLLYGAPVFSLPVALGPTGASFPIDININPQSAGHPVALQLLQIDPGTPYGISFSRAMRLYPQPY